MYTLDLKNVQVPSTASYNMHCLVSVNHSGDCSSLVVLLWLFKVACLCVWQHGRLPWYVC